MNNIDDLRAEIERTWNSRVQNRTIVSHTGRGGAIEFTAQFTIQGKETFGGRTLTKAEKKAIYDEVENSQIWEDGWYEIGGDPIIKYIGLEDTEQPDGTIVVKDKRGVWRVEEWKDGWRRQYGVITEEEARQLIEDNGGKLKTEENG